MRVFARILLSLTLFLAAIPAQAAVTITFWSHELGNSFPHAFFTLRGIPDRGGAPVDANYGFTPVSISPAMLFGNVKGRLDIAKPGYMRGSDAQFSLVLSDAQYDSILALVEEWSERGDPTYNLNTRNCVTFAREAARRAGLSGVDQPKLMKKPRSFLQAVAAANVGRVVIVKQHGKAYMATLAPITPPSVSLGTAVTQPARAQ
ncbi:conserved exported hypothetical protein [Sphingomonas sp. EC-HK361]|uniref:hypothetical protein n=1 Tax=Sphingomonas sp. EC-HK361 TaxID=2038397 RepID=UPI001252A373|nr:hypothetical protein [Sphingomonas sp. EC-HK361]VVT19226.1 conserved exported hypothetical protein [Sphingomonas sp. EC-HK361]